MPLWHVLHLGVRCIAERRSAFEWQAAQQGLEVRGMKSEKPGWKAPREIARTWLSEKKTVHASCKYRQVFLRWQRYVRQQNLVLPISSRHDWCLQHNFVVSLDKLNLNDCESFKLWCKGSFPLFVIVVSPAATKQRREATKTLILSKPSLILMEITSQTNHNVTALQ